MSTPGPGGPQPPEQDPAQQPDQPQNWGQQQPPVGQPGPGQQSWGAAQPVPGQEPAGQVPGQQPWGAPQQPTGAQAFGAQAFGAPGQQDKPKRKLVPILISVLAVVAVALLAFSFLGGGDPEVGDCIHAEGFTDFETVSCDADDADFSIIGLGDEMSSDEFDATPGEELCSEFPDATNVLWYGTEDADADGTVYCVTDV